MSLQEASDAAEDCSAEDDVRKLRLAMVELEQRVSLQKEELKELHKQKVSNILPDNCTNRTCRWMQQ